ncbi:hypothetical protein [Aggregatibacter kilianii]|uniref:hypothetical protein n=1 Tax=Aggregatibacter kilianii TaxID=2025884 RepID=UPI000D65C255|nr:hypothetical protein [Aggregatibacter kilianii]
MDAETIGLLLAAGTFIAFLAWLAEWENNRDKSPEARRNTARTFLILFLVVDGIIAGWIAFFILSFASGFEKDHSFITERLATEQEIQEFAERGLPNLPAGTIIAVEDSGDQRQLRAPEGSTIPWGNLQLDGFNLVSNVPVFSINNPAIHVMGVKDVVCVDDQMPIYRAKPNTTETSLRFEDYRLDSCKVATVTFKNFSPTLKLTNPSYQANTVELFQSPFLPKNVAARYEVNQYEDVITFHTQNQSKNAWVKLEEAYTDEQNRLLALDLRLTDPPQEEIEESHEVENESYAVENDSKVRIGNCDYVPYRTSILLTDFNQGKATWHFESETREIAKECQTQVLPYKMEVRKVR